MNSAPLACGLKERLIEPGIERILDLVVAVCVSGADEYCGVLVVAVDDGERGESATSFEHNGPYDHLAAQPEFLAERVRSGIEITGQQRRKTQVAAIHHL